MRRGRWGGVLAVAAVVLMASCSAGGASPDGASTPASSRSVASPSPEPEPGTTSGGGQQRVADVSVTTDRAVYPPGEAIHVVVRNDGSRDVYAASGQAYCTIVALERSSGGGWHTVAPCAQGAPPGFVRIAAGASLTLDVPPPGSATDGLVPGTYRLRCPFAIGASDGPSGSARSPVFTVES